MKRWLAALIMTATCAHPAAAQKFKGDVVLSMQGGLGVPVGTFSHTHGIGGQFQAQVDYAVADGTAVGVRGGYFNFKPDENSMNEGIKVTNFQLQGKQLFTPEKRFGLYGVAGWGIYWWKEKVAGTLSDAEWGGFAGLGLHYETSDRVAFFGEGTYNGFFSSPDGTSYFSFTVGLTIGIREE